MVNRLQDEAPELSGAQRAAAIVLAMGKPPAARVLKHLGAADLRAIARAANQLGAVPFSALERLVEEFVSDFSQDPGLPGDPGKAKELLRESLPPDHAEDIITETFGAGSTQDIWQIVAKLPEAVVASFVAEERAPTATYILSKLDAERAGKVVSLLPRDLRNAVLCGMAGATPISPVAAGIVENALRQVLTQSGAKGGDDARARLADIINGLDAQEIEDAMAALGQARPKDAEVVKRLLFTFNDLPRLPERARALLFDKAPTEVVVLALRGTDAAFRDSALSSMPARARRLVESELSSATQAPARDIAKARKQIADIVLGMARRGEIELFAGEPPDAG